MTTRARPEADTMPPAPVRRFTVEEYHRMIEAGVFADDDRFELLEGWIIPKPMTRSPPHDVTIDLIHSTLLPLLPPGWRLRNQSAMTTGESEPEPDLAVVRGQARDFLRRHPGLGDVALAIEVSDSTLARDRSFKGRIYARAAIPTYWVVNLVDGLVEVYTDPTGPPDAPSYRSRVDIGPGGELAFVLDGREVARVSASDLLP